MCLVAQSCLTLCDPMSCSLPGSSVHRDPPGKNTGAGCHALLQGIFPNQGLNPGLLHCRQILYLLSHQGSPILNGITKKRSWKGLSLLADTLKMRSYVYVLNLKEKTTYTDTQLCACLSAQPLSFLACNIWHHSCRVGSHITWSHPSLFPRVTWVQHCTRSLPTTWATDPDIVSSIFLCFRFSHLENYGT